MTVSSPTGKVAEVRARLLHLLDELPEGTAIPPERKLAVDWNVARMTLRRAAEGLIDEGLLVRRHGSGTYTTRPRLVRQLTMTSFSEEIRRQGLTPSSQTLDFRRFRATSRIARQLRMPELDPVIRFDRLRFADRDPMAVETTHIPASAVPGLGPNDLTGSWYEVLENRYHICIATGTSEIEPALPDEWTASLLGIPPDQPCFMVHTTSRNAHGRVVEIGSSLYRGDRYTLTVERRPALAPAVFRHRTA